MKARSILIGGMLGISGAVILVSIFNYFHTTTLIREIVYGIWGLMSGAFGLILGGDV